MSMRRSLPNTPAKLSAGPGSLDLEFQSTRLIARDRRSADHHRGDARDPNQMADPHSIESTASRSLV